MYFSICNYYLLLPASLSRNVRFDFQNQQLDITIYRNNR